MSILSCLSRLESLNDENYSVGLQMEIEEAREELKELLRIIEENVDIDDQLSAKEIKFIYGF